MTIPNLRAMHIGAQRYGVEMMLATFARPFKSKLVLAPEQLAFYDADVRAVWYRFMDFEQYCDCVDAYNGLLSEMCVEEGIVLIPVSAHLTGGTEMFRDMCHCTTAGRARKADVMAAFLKDRIAARVRSATP